MKQEAALFKRFSSRNPIKPSTDRSSECGTGNVTKAELEYISTCAWLLLFALKSFVLVKQNQVQCSNGPPVLSLTSQTNQK